MTNDFPRILTLLRKERGISQKQAAQDLGISQALMVAAVVLTVVSGIQYIWNARDIVFRV